MKKLYTLLILCFSPYLFGQLNGTYTIGTGGDYATIQAAGTALSTNGVSGPVVFNIKSGTYSIYNYTFGGVTGTDLTNTVTFQSENLDANSVIISGSSLYVDGTAFIFNKLKFDVYYSSPGVNSNAFKINGSYCTIKDCIFYNANYYNEAFYNNHKDKQTYILVAGSDLTIMNNSFLDSPGCSIATPQSVASTVQNLTITNNVFSGANLNTIKVYLVNNITISHNTIASTTIYYSIFGSGITGNALIDGNTINNPYAISTHDVNMGCLDITAVYPSSSTVSNLIIRNNFINTQRQNLRITNFKNCKIFNNNFKSAYNCLYMGGTGLSTSFIVRNNIFYSTGSYAIYFDNLLLYNIITSDYNAFSVNNGTPIFFSRDPNSSNYYRTLPAWQSESGLEMHSRISDMVYLSGTDLHTPNAFIVSNAGVSLSDVTTDIDGEPRNATTPDIGADEFDMDYTTYRDLEVVSIDSPSQTDCNITTPILSIKNNGHDIVTSFDITASINNYPGALSTFTTPINPGETIQVSIVNLPLILNNVYENLAFTVSNPNHAMDNNYGNNIQALSNYAPLGDFPITVEKDNCGNYKSLTIAMSGNTILWSNGQTGNKIYISSAGTYSVTVTNAVGCTSTKSITLN